MLSEKPGYNMFRQIFNLIKATTFNINRYQFFLGKKMIKFFYQFVICGLNGSLFYLQELDEAEKSVLDDIQHDIQDDDEDGKHYLIACPE